MNSDPSNTNPAEITLKALRESRRLTQEELGDRIGLSYRTIAEWESSRKLPRFDNAVALARELGVSLKVLAKVMQINVEGVPDDELPERWPSQGDG
jgi:transcriptional regulator with XRE-family HTH domain